MLFILFGAFVERSGAGQLFMDFALALAGHTSGGPAKVAIINLVPVRHRIWQCRRQCDDDRDLHDSADAADRLSPGLRRRRGSGGLDRRTADAAVMGAAAFVMAEFLGTSYLTVAAFAILRRSCIYVAVVHGGAFRGQAHRAEGHSQA